jgi:hypothetical protein
MGYVTHIYYITKDHDKNLALDNWISNGNKDINKQSKKVCTDWESLQLKKTTHYHINKWQHKHGQYNNQWMLIVKKI